jgi:hypothetical protein
MARIAQQRDVAFRPARQRIMIDQRSLVSGRTRSEHVLDLRMKTGEGGT